MTVAGSGQGRSSFRLPGPIRKGPCKTVDPYRGGPTQNYQSLPRVSCKLLIPDGTGRPT